MPPAKHDTKPRTVPFLSNMSDSTPVPDIIPTTLPSEPNDASIVSSHSSPLNIKVEFRGILGDMTTIILTNQLTTYNKQKPYKSSYLIGYMYGEPMKLTVDEFIAKMITFVRFFQFKMIRRSMNEFYSEIYSSFIEYKRKSYAHLIADDDDSDHDDNDDDDDELKHYSVLCDRSYIIRLFGIDPY